MKYALLWDIDGTLLDTHGIGKNAMTSAIKSYTKLDVDFDHLKFSGLTDHQIIKALLEYANYSPNNMEFAVEKILELYIQNYLIILKEGKIQVLFLNARNDGTGINLPEATDLILYHKLSSPALENQVFGRALRLGRTENLIVHRLLTPEEQNINNVNQNIDYSQSQQVAIENIERERLRQEREDYELALSLQNNF